MADAIGAARLCGGDPENALSADEHKRIRATTRMLRLLAPLVTKWAGRARAALGPFDTAFEGMGDHDGDLLLAASGALELWTVLAVIEDAVRL